MFWWWEDRQSGDEFRGQQQEPHEGLSSSWSLGAGLDAGLVLPRLWECLFVFWLRDLSSPTREGTQAHGSESAESITESEAKVVVAQSCLTLCDPMDCSPPGSSVHGILQARILEWVAISFWRRSSRPRDWTQVSWIGSRFFIIGTREFPLCMSCWHNTDDVVLQGELQSWFCAFFLSFFFFCLWPNVDSPGVG